MYNVFFDWLLTYLLHSTILLGLAWMFEFLRLLRTSRLRELVWRIALFGGLLTATIQAPMHAVLSQPTSHQTKEYHPYNIPTRQVDSISAVASVSSPLSTALPPAISIPPTIGSVGSFIVIPWLLAVVLGCLHTLLGATRLNATARTCPQSRDPELLHFLHNIAQRNGRPPPILRLTERWRSPLVMPNGEICIPQWTMERLTPVQRQLMLAHELAHVCRRDPAWRIAAQLAMHIGFLQPLNRLALHHLELSAELACDAWATNVAGHRHALAETLLACAQVLQSPKLPTLALGMAHKLSPLFVRITSLMEEKPMFQRSSSTRRTNWIIAGAFAALVTTLPLIAVGVGNVDKNTTLKFKLLDLNANIDGDIQFTKPEDDVSHIGNKAIIEQTVAGKELRIVYKNDGSNGVTRDYSVDGKPHDLDAQGKNWLAQVIPTVLRETGLDAEQRIKRLSERGGTATVLADMEKIRLGHSRVRYIQALVATEQLTPQQIEQLRTIIGGINTDPDRRDAYVAILKRQTLSVPQLGTVLADVTNLRSNEKCDTLVAVAAVMPADATLLQLYRDAAKSLPDQQRGRAEKALDHLKT